VQYKILTDATVAGLTEQVMHHLKTGYYLSGGASMTQRFDESTEAITSTWIQAVTRQPVRMDRW